MNLFRRILAILFLLGGFASAHAICSPVLGLGTIQSFDNNGNPLPTGVLYSFQAGTSTQQATYTDSTCTILNNNPITMTSGGRAQIWLSGSLIYKFVLCLQNDGAVCAPADVLFSVDNVPGAPVAVAVSPFIGVFISNSPNPATTGILELASSDAICWRNVANSANLCITKDNADVLAWAGGDMKFPEINCTATFGGFDYLCADSTQHRWTMFNNGGLKTQIVGAGVDINNSDQVVQWHFGAQATPLSSIPLTAGQSLVWDGSNIVGSGGPTISVANEGATGTTVNTLTKLTGAPSTAILAATTDVGGIVGVTIGGAGITSNALIQQMGPVPCVFDGATTAGDYVVISSTVAGNCHDFGSGFPAPGQRIGRVLSTNLGAGTYVIDLFPPEERNAINLQPSLTTNSGTAIGASATTWITKAITMPNQGCPCRVLASYGAYFSSGGSGTATFWLEDNVGPNQFATSRTLSNSAGGNAGGSSASSISPVTYNNGASVTFTGKGYTDAAGGITVTGPPFGSTQNPWLSLVVLTSN
jgi:hypothetical protein